MDRKVMIDIETTGIDEKRGFILEIAIVIMAKSYDDEEYFAQAQYQTILPYDGSPSTEFARTYQKELYKDCNQLYKSYKDKTSDPIHHGALQARKGVMQFLKANGFSNPDDIKIIGRNIRSFDLEWLYYHGILTRKDHHYRVYDLTSHEDFVVDLGYARKQLHTKVQMMATKPEVPEGPDHRAMRDCLKQCRQYNGLLMLVKRL